MADKQLDCKRLFEGAGDLSGGTVDIMRDTGETPVIIHLPLAHYLH